MKSFITLFLAVVLSLQVQAGNGFDKLFSKYSDSDEVTTINLTESMLRIASKFLDEEDKEAREVLASIKSIKVLVSEAKSITGLYKEATNVLSSGNYEDLVRINDSDEKVRIAVTEAGDLIKDVIIVAESDNEIALINITGDIDVNKIGKALKTLDINVEGLDFDELDKQ